MRYEYIIYMSPKGTKQYSDHVEVYAKNKKVAMERARDIMFNATGSHYVARKANKTGRKIV